jgi:UDP-glucose 4-epimerase
MKLVVFGAAGFVGVNVSAALVARGHSLLLVDRDEPPGAVRAALPGSPWLKGDVRDADFLESAIAQGTDGIVWGAALTADAARDAAEPDAILSVNLAALAAVLRIARSRGVRRVVNLGSVAAFGEAAFRERPLEEDDPVPDPKGLYALSKHSGERLCARYSELTGLTVVTLRLSSVFGPWERMTGARDTPSPFLQLMDLAERGEEARLPRALARDWLYAPDAGEAVTRVLEAQRLRHALYHVGPGRAHSVLDWGAALASRRRGWVCRLAVAGEAPNVDPQGARDRAPMAVERFAADTGFRTGYDPGSSVVHLDAWARAHPGWFGAPETRRSEG